MDDEMVEYFWTLQRVNQDLLAGLKMAIDALENTEKVSGRRRESNIDSLKKLLVRSEMMLEFVNKESRH